MFQCFKDLKILYYTLAFSIAIPLAAYGAIVEKIVFVFLALFIPFVIIIILEVIAHKRYKKINNIRETNCNIVEYYETLCKLRSNIKKPKLLAPIYMNMAVAFLDLGRYEDALNTICCVNLEHLGKGILGLENKVIYFNNLAYAYIGLKDFKNAELVLNNMKTCLDDYQFHKLPEKRNLWYDFYNSKKYIIQMEQGIFDGAEYIFMALMQKSSNNIQQVSASYYLAKIYLNSGENEKAKRYIDFVIKYGGDTVYRAKLLNAVFEK